ncbi:hypothetical protein XH88_22020 [Bradyrhizobium sp. CCBAU 51627]|nr:hypothetical protein [Bradyrhizobium sp. CCBAU 51627]
MQEAAFLARWSRRKQEARAGEPAVQPGANIGPDDVPPAGIAEAPANPAIDHSGLPPVDSIDATTDVSAFLRKGIPQELSRVALRRAWSADPAIRDFVGPAENAWDFNDPIAMEGFGLLGYSPERLEVLVPRLVGGMVQAADSPPDSIAGTLTNAEGAVAQASHHPVDTGEQPVPGEQQFGPIAPQPPTAVRCEADGPPVRRRTHGGALPR